MDGNKYGLQALVARTLMVSQISGGEDLVNNLECDLEEDIELDNKANSENFVDKQRYRCLCFLQSKVFMLFIWLLNVIDCGLVIIEIILDFLYVSDHLGSILDMLQSFIDQMMLKYSPLLDYIPNEAKEVYYLFQDVLDNKLALNTDSAHHNTTQLDVDCAHFLQETATKSGQLMDSFISNIQKPYIFQASSCFETNATLIDDKKYALDYDGHFHGHQDEMAKKIHYACLAIVSVVFLFVILRLLIFQRRFITIRIMLGDGVVVAISLILDWIFISDGLKIDNTTGFVILLMLLLPWKVLRIFTSMAMIVEEDHRECLKCIYKQKKEISRSVGEMSAKIDERKRDIQILQQLCQDRGVPCEGIKQAGLKCQQEVPVSSFKKKMKLLKKVNNAIRGIKTVQAESGKSHIASPEKVAPTIVPEPNDMKGGIHTIYEPLGNNHNINGHLPSQYTNGHTPSQYNTRL